MLNTYVSPEHSFSTPPAPLPANYGIASRFQHMLDLNMLAHFNARERPPEEWKSIAKEAGLRVEKFWECRGVVWITEMRKDEN